MIEWLKEQYRRLITPELAVTFQVTKTPIDSGNASALDLSAGVIPQTVANRNAFLTLISVGEGTEHIGDRGYDALFGGGTFTGYADHPRKSFYIPRLKIYTTAAGRYQILAHVFDSYKKIIGLPDFSPESQDKIVLRLIYERHALPDVDAGRISVAVGKCSGIWASLPGNSYGQPQKPLNQLLMAYSVAGGKNEDWRA